MIDLIGQPLTAALAGAFGGILLGLAARLGRFCTLGAIEDLLYGGSDIRLRMWGLAIAVAILGTFGLSALGGIDLGRAFYLSIGFSLPAAAVGGLLFGYGMALAGNCGYGSIARLGGGDLRAFVVVLVMGLAAGVTLGGPLAPLRVWLFPPSLAGHVPPGFAHLLANWSGLPVTLIGLGIGAVIAGAALASRQFRSDHAAVIWAIVVGFAIVSGWAATAWIARTGFAPQTVISHTYSAPVADSLLFAMQGSARPLSFGIGSVAGVWIGAFLGSIWKGEFRWEACEDPRELRRQIFGGGLMGMGAVIAVGCTIGQGISAASTLAFSAPVTLLAIFAGAALGLRQLITGFGRARV